MAKKKFNIGDHVVIKESNVEFLETFRGKTGVVKDRHDGFSTGYDYLISVDNRPGLDIWCDVKCLVDNKPCEHYVNGFKVGDRVTVDGMTGTLICITMGDMFGVQFDDEKYSGHRCGGVKLKAGKPGDKCNCWWVKPCSVKHYEEPKYYNGKVVCVENLGANASLYTVGKIYEFVNGSFIADNGEEVKGWYRPIKSFHEWERFSGSKWLEIKE